MGHHRDPTFCFATEGPPGLNASPLNGLATVLADAVRIKNTPN